MILTIFWFWWIEPFQSGRLEILHIDVIPHFLATRTWVLNHLHQLNLPLWNPYAGLGRPLEIYLSYPIDILSFVEVFYPLQVWQLHAIQFSFLLMAGVYLFKTLNLGPLSAVFFTILLALSANSIFNFYHIQAGWSWIIFVYSIAEIIQFSKSGRPVTLVRMFVGTFLLGIGSQAPVSLMGFVGLAIFVIGFFFVSTFRKRDAHRGICVLATLLASGMSLIIVYVPVMMSMSVSNRQVGSALNWENFSASMRSAFSLPHNEGVAALGGLIALMILFRRSGRTRRIFAILVLCSSAIVAQTYVPLLELATRGYGLGILAGIAVLGILFLSRTQMIGRLFGYGSALRAMALLLLLVSYWGQPVPGELDEVVYMMRLSPFYQSALAFLVTLGIFFGRRKIANACTGVLAGVLLLRTILMPVFTYGMGMMWLPTRDGFIIETTLVILAALGFEGIYRIGKTFTIKLPSTRFSVVCYRVITGLVISGIITLLPTNLQNPHLVHHIVTTHKFSPIDDWGRGQAEQMKRKMIFRNKEAPRILGFNHYFNSLAKIADAREMQSLISRQYTDYSIFHRQGFDFLAKQDANIGGLTASLSPERERLVPPHDLPFNPRTLLKETGFNYYWASIVHALPPVDCGILRLLGIEYIEPMSYGMLRSNVTNYRDYLFFPNLKTPHEHASEEQKASFVQQRLNTCGFNFQKINQHNWYKIPDPAPRAFFIPSSPHLNAKILSEARHAEFKDGNLILNKTTS